MKNKEYNWFYETPQEISMKLEKKNKKVYLCYPVGKYFFKVKPSFRLS